MARLSSSSGTGFTRAQIRSSSPRPRSRRSDSSITSESRLPVRAALIQTARSTSSSTVRVVRVLAMPAPQRQDAVMRLVRRQVVVPDAERLEGSPEAGLGALFVEGSVDVGDVEGVDGGGEGLDLTLVGLDLMGQGNAEAVEDAQGGLAHDDDDLRLHNRHLLDQAADALPRRQVGLRGRALDAKGAVDDEGVDPEPFEAFHQRVARAAVKGDPLLD